MSRHLIIGQGGTRAILTGLGATLALKMAGLTRWSTVGGISGGAIPAILMANNAHPLMVLDKLLALDFTQLLLPVKSAGNRNAEFAALKEGERTPAHRFAARLLRRGMKCTGKLGEIIEREVKTWPEAFWTMAVSENSHVMFTSTGVFEYGFDGSFEILSDQPAPIALAIRATCAVPGLLEAVEYRGRYLFDGALSPLGESPVAWVREKFFAESGMVVSCVSTGKDSGRHNFLSDLARRLILKNAARVKPDAGQEADISIAPYVPELNALRFMMSESQKKIGLLAGFNAAAAELSRNSGLFQEGVNPPGHCPDFDDLMAKVRQCA